MFFPSTRVLAAAVFALTGLIAPATLAAATSTVPSTSIGYDISWPQCGGHFPSPTGFGIVGVNDGHSFSANPCLASELQWSATTQSAAPQFYANVDNPGPSNNTNWPLNQQTPQVCYGANSLPCSFDYGWDAAQVSFNNALNAETQNNSPAPLAATKAARWWLDVETGNAWESLRTSGAPTSAEYANDGEVLSGELSYFNNIGVTYIGIYSNGPQFKAIMGATGTTFATIPGWMPGTGSLAAAQAACSSPSFTGGRLALIQYPSIGLDGDYLCPLLSTPTDTSLSVAAAATFTQQLSVAGDAATLTWVQSAGTPSLTVSPTGVVATSGNLSAGTYIASGTVSDTNGDSGTFTFSLGVGVLTQSSEIGTSVSVPDSATFNDQLAVTGASGAITYVQTTGTPSMTVSPTGLIATSGALAPGSYVVRGTMSDASADKGTFFFNLKVGTLTQSSSNSATITASASATFNDQLAVTGASGAITYVQTTGTPSMTVSPTGLIATSGALAPGSYVVRGTMSDASADKGTFFFNLKVNADPPPPSPPPTPVLPVAYRVIGHAVAGKTVALIIAGAGFFGRPSVQSHAGTTALVTRDTGNFLSVRVSVTPRSRKGIFMFTVTLANGTSCKVRYNQR